LERLRIARKPGGYALDKDRGESKRYYYRLEFKRTQKHSHAYLIHQTEGSVISASTNEWPIARRLYSNTDVSAAENLGMILGRRCLQAGIFFAHKGAQDIENSEKVHAFYKAVEDSGLTLKEPEIHEKLAHWEEVREPSDGIPLEDDLNFVETADIKR